MSEVYKAIAAIQGKLAKTGIAKEGTNTQQNYKFRGIDQVYAALSPLLAEHGLCVLPRMVALDRSERVTLKPGYQGAPPKESVLFYVTVTAEFDFVAVADGSTHTVRTYGEAMDSGDKATNKAMSAAYKYAAFMAFAIPTEGDNDADATTHEVEPQRQAVRKLDGPYTSKTALWNAVKKWDAECRSITDADALTAFTNTPETVDLWKQLERDAPQLLYGGDGVPPEFESLQNLVNRMSNELEGI